MYIPDIPVSHVIREHIILIAFTRRVVDRKPENKLPCKSRKLKLYFVAGTIKDICDLLYSSLANHPIDACTQRPLLNHKQHFLKCNNSLINIEAYLLFHKEYGNN